MPQVHTDTGTRLLAEMDARIAACMRDGRAEGYFAVIYRNANAHVLKACTTGKFRDPVRVADFMHAFAEAQLRQQDVEAAALPGPWKVAARAARRDKVAIPQHIGLGLNARVNYDLPLALAAFFSPQSLPEFESDFLQINEVIFSTFRNIQDQVGKTLRSDSIASTISLHHAVSAMDKPLLALYRWLFKLQRTVALRNAMEMMNATGRERERRRAALEKWVTARAKMLCYPEPISHAMFRQMKKNETGTVSERIALLNRINESV